MLTFYRVFIVPTSTGAQFWVKTLLLGKVFFSDWCLLQFFFQVDSSCKQYQLLQKFKTDISDCGRHFQNNHSKVINVMPTKHFWSFRAIRALRGHVYELKNVNRKPRHNLYKILPLSNGKFGISVVTSLYRGEFFGWSTEVNCKQERRLENTTIFSMLQQK